MTDHSCPKQGDRDTERWSGLPKATQQELPGFPVGAGTAGHLYFLLLESLRVL